jgi:NADH dehydrogenase
MNSQHHVVIVGGGFAGLNAARALKNAPVRVTLVDRRNFHLFQPLLYQVATAALSPANIASPLRYILKKQENTNVILGEVTDFDLKEHRVKLSDGELIYDSLIVAAGSENNFFGHDDWAEHATGLKSLEDAIEMRRKILFAFESAEKEKDPDVRKAWLTFVVVGAGPTGVELAGALGEIAGDTLRNEFRSIHTETAQILLVDAVPRVLPPYPEVLSAKAEIALKHLGVTFMRETSVTGISADSLTVRHGQDERRIPTYTVLWAAGVKASPLGQKVGIRAGVALQRGGKLPVQPNLSMPGFPNVFVVGDLAWLPDASGKPLPGTAPVAMQQGRYVARQIAETLAGRKTLPFKYVHKGDMATIGRKAAVADFAGFRFDGTLAWLSWLFVHLWYIAEFEDRLLVFLQWAWNYVTRNRGARLITGDN